jgi:hypothetical protein
MVPLSMGVSNIRIPTEQGDVGLIFSLFLCEVNLEGPIVLSQEHCQFNWVIPEAAVALLSSNYPDELRKQIANATCFLS